MYEYLNTYSLGFKVNLFIIYVLHFKYLIYCFIVLVLATIAFQFNYLRLTLKRIRAFQ